MAAPKSWETVRQWNAAAERAGVRKSVFPSLCDPFEDWQGPIMASGKRAALDDVRREFFRLIDETPWLNWLLLTKRPQNVRRMWPEKPFDNAAWNGTLAGYWHQTERINFRPNVSANIRDDCQSAGVPCFIKQLGAYVTNAGIDVHPQPKDRKGGDWSEWPQILRVRQMPHAWEADGLRTRE